MAYFRDKFHGASTGVTALYDQNGFEKHGVTVPAGKVLDGPNPYLGDRRDEYGPNGYLVLEFPDSTIKESYRLPNGEEIFTTKRPSLA